MKKWLYILAGLLATLGLYILGGPGRAATKAGIQRDELLKDGSGRARAKAHQLGIKADNHQRNAVVAAEVGKKTLDNVGSQDETIASVLDNWRKPDGV